MMSIFIPSASIVWATQDVEYPYQLLKSMPIVEYIQERENIMRRAIWHSRNIPDDMCFALKEVLQDYPELFVHISGYDDDRESAYFYTLYRCDKLVQYNFWNA